MYVYFGNRAIVSIPGQRGRNVTMCASIGQRAFIHHYAQLGPYNQFASPSLLTFPHKLKLSSACGTAPGNGGCM